MDPVKIIVHLAFIDFFFFWYVTVLVFMYCSLTLRVHVTPYPHQRISFLENKVFLLYTLFISSLKWHSKKAFSLFL